MDRDHHLRLVGAKSPAPVARASLPIRKDRPPEHASAEAMLRWARTQRDKGADDGAAPRRAKSSKEFAALAFAAPTADEGVIAQILPKQRKNPAKRFFVVGAAGILLIIGVVAGLMTAFSDQPESAAPINTAMPAIVNTGSAAGPRVASLSPEPLILVSAAPAVEILYPAPIFPVRRGLHMALAGSDLTPEAEFLPSHLARTTTAWLVPESLGPTETPELVRIPTATDLVPARQRPGAMLLGSQSEHQFAPPVQFSLADLEQGASALLRMLTGQEPAAGVKDVPETAVIELGHPLIYVRHGLGVSPDTVRKVMQQLTSSGYDRVFQVGVPFRVGRTNVRFYYASDLKLAQMIVDAVIPIVAGPQFSEPRDFSDYSNPPQPGTIDVWLSDRS